jgi:hypothetical protein
MPCARCATTLPEYGAYCPRCGHARKDKRARPDDRDGEEHVRIEDCASCKAPVDKPDWVFCPSCGRRLEHVFHAQSRGYTCGPAAMRNALALIGLTEDESRLRELMGARAFIGTPDEGFVLAAEALRIEHEHVIDGDLDRLRQETSAGNPCILDWRHGQHYVCAFAVTERHVFFVDSNPRDTDMVRFMTHERFLMFWWDSDNPHDRHHAMHIFRHRVRRE